MEVRSKRKTFKVYQNPLRGEIYVDLNDYASVASYKILNNQGDIVRERNILENRNTISLDSLPSGTYVLTVLGKNQTIIKNFLRL